MSLSDISIYFTEDTLNKCIQKAGGVKYVNWSFGSGFKKGDSYLSDVYRFQINGVDNKGDAVEVNLIVKSMPKNASRRKLFRSADFFRNEINFYTKVIPAFEKFQSSRHTINPFVEYPKHYASHCDGENDFIALQDVSILGYGPPSRLETIDHDHFKLIMKALGRFHAVSLAFRDQEPEEFKKVAASLEETYYAEKNKEWYRPFLVDAIKVANDALEQEYPGTIYEEKAKKYIGNNLYDTLCHLVTVRNNYSVIGHGDCWTPNFLIKYDDHKNPKQTTIIDFQLARYGSLALDLSFFIYSCTSHETREKHLSEILKEYHESACELIKNIGSDPQKIFPYAALKSEMRDFAKFGCGMAIESLPLSMMEDDEVADLDQITGDNPILTDVWKISPIPEKKKRLRIADAFKHAIDSGYIV